MKHQAQGTGLLGETVAAGLVRAWRFSPDALECPLHPSDTIHELLRQMQARLQKKQTSTGVHVDTAGDPLP